MEIDEHKKINNCFENYLKTMTENSHDLKDKNLEKKDLVDKNDVKNEHNKKIIRILPTSKQLLFTCLKPSCNLIFQNFINFRVHYRDHFEIGKMVMCWQCLLTFSDYNVLHLHQKNNCKTTNVYKSFECSTDYNYIQWLSIHKYIIHNGTLIPNKYEINNKNVIKCAFCTTDILVDNYKSHLIRCHTKKVKLMNTLKCEFCGKILQTQDALIIHIKMHSVLSKTC